MHLLKGRQASQLLFVIEKIARVNDMTNAFDTFYSSPHRFIQLLSHCFAAVFAASATFIKDICGPFTRAIFTCHRKRVIENFLPVYTSKETCKSWKIARINAA